jgi:neutral ceramidase
MSIFHAVRLRAAKAIVAVVSIACMSPCKVGRAEEAPDSGGKVLRAGAFAIDITPTSFPVDSAGSMSPRLATFANDPLHARCMVLDDGTTRVAFAICDHCMIPRELIDRARRIVEEKCGIPADHVLCSATHTHTGVTLTPTFQSTVDDAYCDLLVERIAEGICRANERLAPAKLGWTVGHNPNQVFNRRWHMRSGFEITDPFDVGKDQVRMNPPAGSSKLLKPAGPIDPEIPIISVVSPEGVPIALLANYSLHYVGGVPGGALSADYFGEFARQYATLAGIESGSEFVAMMTNGTSGNINNINFFDGTATQPPFEQIRLVARDLAESVVQAMKRMEYVDWAPIHVANEELQLHVRKPSSAELERARALIQEAGDPPYHDVRLVYANETLDLQEYPETVNARIQAIRIGELGIVSSPCETFVETGLALKQSSPFRTAFTIELANGYNGYLPTASHHQLGGYETWRAKSSYLTSDAEQLVFEAQLRLLNTLSQ